MTKPKAKPRRKRKALTLVEIRMIRKLWDGRASYGLQKEMAHQFGVSISCIHKVCNRMSHAYVA